jgi:hypothetical protein
MPLRFTHFAWDTRSIKTCRIRNLARWIGWPPAAYRWHSGCSERPEGVPPAALDQVPTPCGAGAAEAEAVLSRICEDEERHTRELIDILGRLDPYA